MSAPLPPSRHDIKLELLLDALKSGRPQTMVARGASMWPALRDGDTVELTTFDGVPPLGAIVAVWSTGRFLIHRACGVRSDGALLLKGDNNPWPDGWFSPLEQVAVVVRVDHGRGFGPVPAASFSASESVRFRARILGRVLRVLESGRMWVRGGRPRRDERGAQQEATL